MSFIVHLPPNPFWLVFMGHKRRRNGNTFSKEHTSMQLTEANAGEKKKLRAFSWLLAVWLSLHSKIDPHILTYCIIFLRRIFCHFKVAFFANMFCSFYRFEFMLPGKCDRNEICTEIATWECNSSSSSKCSFFLLSLIRFLRSICQSKRCNLLQFLPLLASER